jgi:predicted amidohydrolase
MTERRPGPRPAVVGTCTLSPFNVSGGDAERLRSGLALVDDMARQAEQKGWALDMVLLPEHFAQGEDQPPSENSQPLDGPIVSALAEKARDYKTHVAVPLRLREGDECFNALVVLGRTGEPVGIYRKAFPVLVPDGTLEGGITPGHEFPVFELDFGRVGAQICFDVFFDDGWQALDAGCAELVLFSSATSGVAWLRSHANRHQYYVAASTFRPPSIIVDPVGREIARSAADKEALVVRIDLDYRVLPWNSLRDWGKAQLEKYGPRIRQDWHYEEDHCLVTSTDPDLPVGEWLAREGLETSREHLARNLPVITANRGGPVQKSASSPSGGI